LTFHIHICVCGTMASRNVALRMEAYRALDRERRPGESFSDAVLRLASNRKSLSEIIASFEPLGATASAELDRNIARVRRDTERSMRGRLRWR